MLQYQPTEYRILRAFSHLMAFILFLTTIKLCRLLRYTHSLRRMLTTFRVIRPQILGYHDTPSAFLVPSLPTCSFGVISALLFVAFANGFHFLLGRQLWAFASYPRTLAGVVAMVIGRWELAGLTEASWLAAPLCFALATTAIFLILNLIATLLNHSHTQALPHPLLTASLLSPSSRSTSTPTGAE